MARPELIVYGDFNCPWSLLASRRVSLLEADGVHVDWRAVEHDPISATRAGDDPARFAALRGDAQAVLEWLLPGERMPYALAGFATDTRAAITGYAESYQVGAAAIARPVLFDAFWTHSVDLADAHVVHTLLVDALRTARTPRGEWRRWDYPVSGGSSQRSVRGWAAAWRTFEDATVPALVLNDTSRIVGKAAIEWLGRELLTRRIEPDPSVEPAATRPGEVRLPTLEAAFRGRSVESARARPAARTGRPPRTLSATGSG